MKMSATLIIGIVLILMGLSAIIKIAFNVDFPIFKIAFACLFIYIGVKVLMGNSFNFFGDKQQDEVVFFGEKTIQQVDDGKQYSVFFGGATYNLSNVQLGDTDVHIKLNTIFGGSKLILNNNLPVRITSNTIFGGTVMPNGNSSAFGSAEYDSDSSLTDSTAHLVIESNTIFGGLKVVKY